MVEVDPDEFDMNRLQSLFMQYGSYPPTETLDRKISTETYALVEKKFQEAGMPMEPFKRFKPWVLAVMLQSVELQRLGFDKNMGSMTIFSPGPRGKSRSRRSKRWNIR